MAPPAAPTLVGMRQPGALSRTVLALLWLGLGTAMIAVTVWLGWTRGATILSGHPATVVLGIATGLLGFVALAWSIASLTIGDRQDREGDSQQPARRTRTQLERRAKARIVLAVPFLVLGFLAVVVLGYTRPATAEPQAVAAFRSAKDVSVIDRLTWYELVPSRLDKSGNPTRPTTGLIFLPGARVDPRAYAPELRQLADAGYLVVVLKEPFGFSVFDRNHAQSAIDAHPEIGHWGIGGHSLGGTIAASFAADHRQIEALLLLASYPADRVGRGDLSVTSISGDRDGLATPEKIEKSKANLPAATRFIVIDGASHASFADYGRQPGDGTPTADRKTVQAEVAKAAVKLLAALTPKKPK